MRAFIAHGEADQAIADELKEYLKPLGLFAETETGARGFRHLQKSDVVIALWSRNALFTAHRMMLEKRMLDAWADGQLVLVKLDHNFFPVGMRDLPYIDATFEAARKTTAWRDISRQAKETMNRLLVEQQRPAPAPPVASAPGAGGSPSGGEDDAWTGGKAHSIESDPKERVTRDRGQARKRRAAPQPRTQAKSGSNWFLVLSATLLTLALVAVGANVLLQRINEPHESPVDPGSEAPVVATVQDTRVTADFLALLQNADLANGAAEAAKCQMCHSFDAGGPALLGPPLYDLIGKDIAAHDGFAYSSGGAGLADIDGVWTYRNLNQYLERPKSIAADTTMIFAGMPRESARADLIAYLRTLTPGDVAPLPEALPPGVAIDTAPATDPGPTTPPPEIAEAESPIASAMRQLRDVSDDVLRQPLLIGGVALVLLSVMLFVGRLSMGRRGPRASAEPPPSVEPEAEQEAMEEVIGNLALAAGDGDALFISYAHDDNDRVEPVVKIVKSNGREVWIDKGGIQAGEGWAGEIVRAIKSAGGVMVMCSQRAFESDHIKREIYLADRYKKTLLPIFLEPAQPPEDFEYFFAGVQWLELFKLPEADRAGAIGRALAAV